MNPHLTGRPAAPTGKGIGTGAGLSILSLIVYLTVFHAAGSLFYPFAAFWFLACPLIAGFMAVRNPALRKTSAFCIAGGAVFGISFVLFMLTYAFSILFFMPAVILPARCDGTYHPDDTPASLRYPLLGGAGIVISEDPGTVIAVRAGGAQPSHPATVYLINRSTGSILWSAGFPDDNIAAAMDHDTAYIFWQGLGSFIDTQTGERYDRFLAIDNYGTNTDGTFQTAGIISSWSRDGTVKSLPRLSFSGIARGCLVNGSTGEITQL